MKVIPDNDPLFSIFSQIIPRRHWSLLSPISTLIEERKIVYCFADSFCTGDIVITPNSCQRFLSPLVKRLPSEALHLHPVWRLIYSRSVDVGQGDAFPFTGRVRKHFRLTSHSLTSRSMPLTEVAAEVPMRFIEAICENRMQDVDQYRFAYQYT